MDKRPVEMVRVEREEEYFEREAVLGRDASSVFPTEAKKAAVLDPEALKAAIGGDRKFISATELEEIKKRRGLTVEDGTLAPTKPLAEVLAEAKEKKQAEFEAMWKQMKTGKNRPLDEDEFEFLDGVAEAEAAAERAVREAEAAELEAFQEALRQQQEAREAEELAKQAKPAAPAAHKQQQHKRPAAAVKPRLLVVKPGSSSGPGRPNHSAAVAGEASGSGSEPASKRQRGEADQGLQQQQQQEEPDVGLPGLLGGYGSDSEGDSDV